VATGGRNGHTQSDDGIVSVNYLSKAMEALEKWCNNPEHLFAAGYAACSEAHVSLFAPLKLIPKQ